MKMNLGCGPDIKEGFVNVDIVPYEGASVWDMTKDSVPGYWVGKFDYVLVNHTICLISYDEVAELFKKIQTAMKPGATIEIIDMDVTKAFNSYTRNDHEGLPGFGGSIDNSLCRHLIGHGRKSVYTGNLVAEMLINAGFGKVEVGDSSEHDLRPKESLIVRGVL